MTSRWALALKGDGEPLRELVGAFWYPPYAFFRSSGSVPELAVAQVESLVARLLTEPIANDESAPTPTFRETMLRLSEETLVEEELRPAEVRVDGEWAEGKFAKEPQKDPATVFQRRWALTILEYTLSLLEGQYVEEGRQLQFSEYQKFLGYAESGEAAYAKAAEHLGISQSAVRTGVFEVRKRYREKLRAQIFDTVANEAALETEHTNLLGGL